MALTQISTAGVKDDAVTAGKIPANAVGSSELADNAVDTAAIADDAVTAAKLASNAVVNASVDASAAIAGTKISPDFGSQAISTTGGLSINGATVFNESGADVDFRIEGDTESNLFYVDAGNDRIGMGTPSPQYSLQIHKGDSSASVIQITNSTTGSGNTDGFQFGVDSSEQAFFNMRENKPIIFELNGSERMRMDSSGRVLMGSTSSTASDSVLQVRQDSSGANFEVIRSYNDANTPARVRFANSRGTAASPAVVANGDDLGELRFTGHDGTDYNNTAASIIAAVDGGAAANDMPGRLEFLTTADGANTPTERMRIDSSGKLMVGGTTADAKFAVIDSSNPDIALRYNGTSGGHKTRLMFVDKRGVTNAQVANILHNDGVGTAAADLEFATATGGTLTARMKISKEGYVTKPYQPMANVGLSSSTQTSTGVIMFNYVRINQGSIYNTANGRFTAPVAGKYFINIFGMSDSDNTMDIQLEVNGSVQNALAPYNSGTGGQHNQISASAIINLSANDYMHFKLNNGSFYAGTTGRHGGASCFLIG